MRLSHERFEFPGLGIASVCPISVYIMQDGTFVVLLFQDKARNTGTNPVNGFESLASIVYRYQKWPEKIRFFIRVEKSQGEALLGIPETYYDEVHFRVAPMKQIDATRFKKMFSLTEGNKVFGLQ